MKCTYCRGEQDVQVHLHGDGTYRIETTPKGTLEHILHNALLGYWRWIAEGKPKHHTTFNRNKEKVQYYYDHYHDQIDFKAEDGIYSFRIQLSDSPDGDEWAYGDFKLHPDQTIEILERHQSIC